MHGKILIAVTAGLMLAGCGQGGQTTGASLGAAEAATGGEAVDLSAARSGTYSSDDGHRYITFSYWHQGYSRPHVRFRDWTATLEWNAEDPEASSVTVTINAASIDSGVDRFDDHLRSPDMFETETWPEITFVSTSLDRTGPNTGTITGDLTIKDVTRPITLDTVINKAAFEERPNAYKLGFSATGSFNRSDFGVDYAVPFVGDEVEMIVEVEFASPAGD